MIHRYSFPPRAGRKAALGLGLGFAGTTTGPDLTAGGGATTGFTEGAGADLALIVGAGPNVIRGRSGSAAMRGFEIGKSSSAIAGAIFA